MGDPALARLAEMNIDPKVVARRFLWLGNWGTLETLFFHTHLFGGLFNPLLSGKPHRFHHIA